VELKRGDPVGEFNLGSSIVLIFEAPEGFSFGVAPGDRVFFGSALGGRAEAAHISEAAHIPEAVVFH
jgi:phosphatidylserine decarboxylase